MRTRFFQLPGISFVSIGLQTGNARAIEIDNSSGSWLLIPSMETYIPPYTVGWSMDFPYAVTSLDIIAGQNGPAGQISTTQGSGVTVYLTDGTVGASPGAIDPNAPGASAAIDTTGGKIPFVQGFTPIITYDDTTPIRLSVGINGIIVPAIVGKRFRIRAVEIVLQPFVGSPQIPWDTGVLYTIKSASTRPINGRITREHPESVRAYPAGLDWPMSQEIAFEAFADFADAFITRSISYEII